VAQGLLPEPARTGRNMAYYDPSCVERIEFIKNIQAGYSFPLSKIKALLGRRDQGRDITPLLELSETIFEKKDTLSLDMAAFCTTCGLDREQVEELIAQGLLLPLEKERFNGLDVSMGRIYAQGLNRGIKVSDLTFYREAANKIVDEEMKLRQRLTAGLPDDKNATLTRNMVQGARAVRNYVIDRSFQQRVASSSDLKDADDLS
jgi:DNA-binding transcriptional MerR regulator